MYLCARRNEDSCSAEKDVSVLPLGRAGNRRRSKASTAEIATITATRAIVSPRPDLIQESVGKGHLSDK